MLPRNANIPRRFLFSATMPDRAQKRFRTILCERSSEALFIKRFRDSLQIPLCMGMHTPSRRKFLTNKSSLLNFD